MLDVQKFTAGLQDYLARSLKPLADRIKALEEREPERGVDGVDGKDGVDGESVSVEDVERMVEARMSAWALDFERRAQGVLERAVDRLPKPENGKDGRDGKDGADGVGFDDLSVEHDGERSVTLKFTRGDVCKQFQVDLPAMIDRGVHKPDSVYSRGDAVTFGGSLWIAQKDAPDGKPGLCDGWRLAVKKGRDGRDGEPGKKGDPGQRGLPGTNGRDLR